MSHCTKNDKKKGNQNKGTFFFKEAKKGKMIHWDMIIFIWHWWLYGRFHRFVVALSELLQPYSPGATLSIHSDPNPNIKVVWECFCATIDDKIMRVCWSYSIKCRSISVPRSEPAVCRTVFDRLTPLDLGVMCTHPLVSPTQKAEPHWWSQSRASTSNLKH